MDTVQYITSVYSNLPYYTSVPLSRTSSFSGYFLSDSISFALQPIPNKQDLVINAVPLTVARPGFNTTYKLYYKNVGTTTLSTGEVLFKKDSRLNLISSFPAMSSSNGDTLKWSYSDLAPADTASITIQLQILAPPAVNNGDTLISVAIITPVTGDETPRDDTSFIRHRVTGSFDPNDKYENNGGIIRPEHITNGDYLNYTIRFQNTGTDTAFTVVVRDTLDAKVEWNTLQMISASHSYDLSIVDGDKLTWTFSGINLPDSNINEPASHGFIAYRIKPKNTVAVGDTVHNTASIYFDFNLPVLTNNAFTTVQTEIVLPLKLISFSGLYINNIARLHWTTQGEYDFEKFIVERSGNGRDFKAVGNKLSNGSRNGLTDYEFADDLSIVQGEVFYYRLKMQDIDGRVSYSSIITLLRKAGTHPVTVFPNPVANGSATATIISATEVFAKINVIDASGKVLRTKNHILYQGTNYIAIDNLVLLPKGVYTIQVINGNQITNKQILITK